MWQYAPHFGEQRCLAMVDYIHVERSAYTHFRRDPISMPNRSQNLIKQWNIFSKDTLNNVELFFFRLVFVLFIFSWFKMFLKKNGIHEWWKNVNEYEPGHCLVNDLIFLFHIFPSYFLFFLIFWFFIVSSLLLLFHPLDDSGPAKRLIDSSRFSLKEMVKIISFFFFFFLLFCLGGIDFRLRLITMSWRYMMMPDGSPATPACWPGPLNYSDSDARRYLNNTRKQRYTGATHAGRCCCCACRRIFFFF